MAAVQEAVRLRPIDPFWVFSALAVSSRKSPNTPIGFAWISLDSLVRIETYQWVTMDFRKGIFLSPFPKMNKDGMGDGVLEMRKRRIAHEVSLTQILIFRNNSSSDRFLICPPQPKK
jgi:hypothetical protein